MSRSVAATAPLRRLCSGVCEGGDLDVMHEMPRDCTELSLWISLRSESECIDRHRIVHGGFAEWQLRQSHRAE